MKPFFLRILFLCFVLAGQAAWACECPYSVLSLEECNKYEIIFKGKVVSVKPCVDKPGEVLFELEELYKGNSGKNFKVLFDCNSECAMKFLPGDEWIIYSRYKQIDNAMMDWCSRSRKYFKNENEDFYTVTYGNDYYDEVKFLRKQLGVHRFLLSKSAETLNRNVIPGINQTVILVICSLLAIVLFYWLLNRYLKF